MNKILVILGPTSSGKTDLGLSFAKKYNGEIISCDSRQVYKGLDIGTGKAPTEISNLQFSIFKGEGFWEINRIRVWMYDVADPKSRYDVKQYLKKTRLIMEDIFNRGKLPIIVGGTGLYLKGILEGFDELEIPVDPDLRRFLEKLTKLELQENLKKVSLKTWEKLNNSEKNNPRRLIRQIEKIQNTGLVLDKSKRVKVKNRTCSSSPFQSNKNIYSSSGLSREVNFLKIGLKASREILNKRIDRRVDARIEQGMIEEVQSLIKNGLSLQRMEELGLEYGVLAKYLKGEIGSIGEVREILKTKIHQFAKRQMTWFKREKDIVWFDITNKGWEEKVEKIVDNWYNS